MKMTEHSDDEEAEIGWLSPYVAAAFDWAGMLHVAVRKKGSYKLGYALEFRIKFQKTDKTAIGLVDEFCEYVGVTPNLNIDEQDGRDVYELTITDRDDIATFLEAVYPFLVIRSEQAEILLEHVFPKLAENEHSTKRGFLDVMYYIDEVRDAGSQRGSGTRKYDLEYFQNEWEMR